MIIHFCVISCLFQQARSIACDISHLFFGNAFVNRSLTEACLIRFSWWFKVGGYTETHTKRDRANVVKGPEASYAVSKKSVLAEVV